MEERKQKLKIQARYLNGKHRRMMSVLLIVTMLFSNIGSSITTAYASVTGYTKKLHVRIDSDAVVDTLLSSGGYGIDFDSEISDYLMNIGESEEVSSALYEQLMKEMEQENRHLISQKRYEGLGVFLLSENNPEKIEVLSDAELDLEEISKKAFSIDVDDELVEGENSNAEVDHNDNEDDFEADEDREQNQLLTKDRRQVAASVEKLVLVVTNFSEESTYDVYVSMTDGEFELSEVELITTSFRQKKDPSASESVLAKQPAGNGEAPGSEAESSEVESSEIESSEVESSEVESSEVESSEIESSVDMEASEGLENGADTTDTSQEGAKKESEPSGEITGTNTEGDYTPNVTDDVEEDAPPAENKASIEENTPPMVQAALVAETDPVETDSVTESLESKETDKKDDDDDEALEEEAIVVKTTEKEVNAEALKSFVTADGAAGSKAKGGYKVSVKPNMIAALVIELEAKEVLELPTGTLRIENVDEELELGDKLVTYLVQLEDADTGELEPYHGMVDFYLIGDEELVDTYEMSDGLLKLPANWAAEITNIPYGTTYDVEIQENDDNAAADNVHTFRLSGMQSAPVEDDGVQVLFASGTSKVSGSVNGTEVLSSQPKGTEKAVTVYMYGADGKGIQDARFSLAVSGTPIENKTDANGCVALSYAKYGESLNNISRLHVYMITGSNKQTTVAAYQKANEKGGWTSYEIEGYTVEVTDNNTNKPVITMRKKPSELELSPVIQGTQNPDAAFTYKITNTATGSAYTGEVDVDGTSQSITNGEITLTAGQKAKVKVTETVLIKETYSQYPISRVILNGVQKSNPVEYKPEREQETLAFVHKRLTEDGGVNVTKKAERISNGLYNVELSVSGKPTSTETAGKVNVVVVIDYSGSMKTSHMGGKTRLEVVNDAVSAMAMSLLQENSQNKMSVVGYNGTYDENDGTPDAFQVVDWTNNSEGLISKLASQSASGETHCAAGFDMAKTMLASEAVDKDAQKIIVYLSDGRANLPNNRAVPAAIEAAKSINIEYPEVSIITMGISTTPGKDVLAPTGDDKYWDMYTEAKDADAVIKAFQAITNIVTKKYEKPEVIDQLGDHVELVESTFSTKKNGEKFEAGSIKMSAGNRIITWDLIDGPENDELAAFDDVYTLSYQIKVKDSINVDHNPYDKKGEVDTGTHAGELGWWSNQEAKLYCNDNRIYEVATFPLPVVQKDSKWNPNAIKIKKVDGNGSPLSGVTFTVMKTGKQTGVSQTTDTNGIAEFTNLDAYEYVVTETPGSNYIGVEPFNVDFTGKAGYSASGSVSSTMAGGTQVSIVSGMDGVVTVTNYMGAAGFAVKKVDANDNDKALSGAVFELQTKNEGAWTTVPGSEQTTRADGFVSFTDLHAGTVYKLLENQAPTNYQLNADNAYYVTVRVDTDKIARIYPCSENGVIAADASSLSVQNPLVVMNAKKTGVLNLTIEKEISGGTALPDAQKQFRFQLTALDGTATYTGTIALAGTAASGSRIQWDTGKEPNFASMPYGQYQLEELGTNANFVLDRVSVTDEGTFHSNTDADKKVTFVLDHESAGKTLHVRFVNKPMVNGSIQLTKTITSVLTEADITKEFTFVVYEKTSAGSMQTTGKSIKVQRDKAETVGGLELGKTYYLAEEADAVYKLNSINIGDAAITPETIDGITYYPVPITGSAPVDLRAVNEPRTFSGDITINKAVVNTFMLRDNNSLGAPQNKFTFILKGPGNIEETIGIDVKKDGTGTAETLNKPQGGWPQGTYVLTETGVEDKGNNLEKYTLTSNIGAVSGKTITFTIDGSNVGSTEDISIVATNTLKMLENSSIKVNKVAEGHDLAGKEFKFTLYRVGGGQVSEMAVKASTTGTFNLAQATVGPYYIVEEESPLYKTRFSAEGVTGSSIFDSTVQLGEQIVQLDDGGTERRFYFDLTEDHAQTIQIKATNTVNRTGVQVRATKEWIADESVLNAPDTLSFSFMLEQKSADAYVLIAKGAAAGIRSDVPSTIIWTMEETRQSTSELKNLEYGTYRISEVIAADAEFTLDQVMINGARAEEISGGYEFQLSENTVDDVVVAFTNHINYQGKPDGDDGLVFDKVRAGNPGRKLAGAEFTLYRQVTDNPEEDVKSVENQIGTAGEFISDDSGVVRVAGVIPGNYILKETKAPTGYQLSSQLITFTVNHDGRTGNVKGLTEQANANRYFANSPTGETPSEGGTPGGNPSGGGTPGGNPGSGGTTIAPASVPLAIMPEDQSVMTIDDGEIPLAPIPKTGEPSEAAKMMLFISGMMMAAAIALGKKKEEE